MTNKLLAISTTLLLSSSIALSQCKTPSCLNITNIQSSVEKRDFVNANQYKIQHNVEHFDIDSNIDGLSIEHRKFIELLSFKHQQKYINLLDSIEMRYLYAPKRIMSCLYKMNLTHVPPLKDVINECD